MEAGESTPLLSERLQERFQAHLSAGGDINDMNVESPQGGGYLHIAAERGDLENIRRLLAEGADPNAQAYGGLTPLHNAVSTCRMDVIDLLLDAGADPCLGGGTAGTPLDLARRHGLDKIAARLLSAR